MKKGKRLAALTLTPVVAITPTFFFSCSRTKTYKIMNLDETCTVKSGPNVTKQVTVASGIYVLDNDNQKIAIKADKCSIKCEGPAKDFITEPKIVQDEDNISVSIEANVNNWDGEAIGKNDIYLSIELELSNGTPIDTRVYVVIDHDYNIQAQHEIWLIPKDTYKNQLLLRDGELPVFGVDPSWSITNYDGISNKLLEIDEINGLLQLDESFTFSKDQYTITITATVGEYKLSKEINILEGNPSTLLIAML